MTGPDEREFFDHLQAGASSAPPSAPEGDTEEADEAPRSAAEAPPAEQAPAAPGSTGSGAPSADSPSPGSLTSPPRSAAQGPYTGHTAPPQRPPRWVPSNAPQAGRPGESRDQPPAAAPPLGSRDAGPGTDPRAPTASGPRYSQPPSGTISAAGPGRPSGPVSAPSSGPISTPGSGPMSAPSSGRTSAPTSGPIAAHRPGPDTELPGPAERPWGGAAGEGATTWELMRDQLRASNLTPVRKIPPSRGWRKWLYSASFGRINPGESPDEQRLRALNATVDTPLRGTYSVVVLGGKGGAGKTTTAAAIGSTLALLRNDKVVAIDADSAQAANLAARIDPRASSSFGEVIADQQLSRYSDMRSHVGQNAAGLDVLASSPQAGRSPVDAPTYTEAHRRLERFYSLLIADCGVDLQHPVTAGVLGCADAVVLVASAVPDGAEGAAKVMDWLSEMGYRQLASRMLVVINHIRPYSSRRDKKQSGQLVATLVERFGDWVGKDKVFVVPFDAHIANAGVLDLDQLRGQTRRRFLEITAMLASGFTATTEGRR